MPLAFHPAGLWDMPGTSRAMAGLDGARHAPRGDPLLRPVHDAREPRVRGRPRAPSAAPRRACSSAAAAGSRTGWIGSTSSPRATAGSCLGLDQKPSAYFRRQGFVSFDPGEHTMGALAPLRRRRHDDLGVRLPAQRRQLSRRRRRAARAHDRHGIRRRASLLGAPRRRNALRRSRTGGGSHELRPRGARRPRSSTAPACRRSRPTSPCATARIARIGRVTEAGAPHDRRRRLRRRAGLHRRAHALRRAAPLGADGVAGVVARRHDRADGQLRLHARARASPRTRAGSRRCCRASRACRRTALAQRASLVGRQLRPVPARARRPHRRQHGRATSATRRSAATSMGDAASERARDAGRGRRHAGARPPGDARGRDRLLDVAARHPRRARRARGAVEPRRARGDRRRSRPSSSEFDHGAIEIIPRTLRRGLRRGRPPAAPRPLPRRRAGRSSSTRSSPLPHQMDGWRRGARLRAARRSGQGAAPPSDVRDQRARRALLARHDLPVRRDADVARDALCLRRRARAAAAATPPSRETLLAELADPAGRAFVFVWQVVFVEAVTRAASTSAGSACTWRDVAERVGKTPLDAFLDLALAEDLTTQFRVERAERPRRATRRPPSSCAIRSCMAGLERRRRAPAVVHRAPTTRRGSSREWVPEHADARAGGRRSSRWCRPRSHGIARPRRRPRGRRGRSRRLRSEPRSAARRRRLVHDFPAGAGRYVVGAEGYVATVVNGEVVFDARAVHRRAAGHGPARVEKRVAAGAPGRRGHREGGRRGALRRRSGCVGELDAKERAARRRGLGRRSDRRAPRPSDARSRGRAPSRSAFCEKRLSTRARASSVMPGPLSRTSRARRAVLRPDRDREAAIGGEHRDDGVDGVVDEVREHLAELLPSARTTTPGSVETSMRTSSLLGAAAAWGRSVTRTSSSQVDGLEAVLLASRELQEAAHLRFDHVRARPG
mgnify:CR=1 FL=1